MPGAAARPPGRVEAAQAGVEGREQAGGVGARAAGSRCRPRRARARLPRRAGRTAAQGLEGGLRAPRARGLPAVAGPCVGPLRPRARPAAEAARAPTPVRARRVRPVRPPTARTTPPRPRTASARACASPRRATGSARRAARLLRGLDLVQVGAQRGEDLVLEVLDQPADRARVGDLGRGRLVAGLARGLGFGGPSPYLVDEFLERGRRRPGQGDRGDLVVPVDPYLRDGQQLPLGARLFAEDEEQLVAGPEGVGGALDEELGAALQVLRGDEGGPPAADLELVPVPAGRQVAAGLEGLRLLVGGRGHAVAARAARDHHGQRLGARVAFEGVREVGGGGDAGARPVADEAAEQRRASGARWPCGGRPRRRSARSGR